MKPPLAAGLLAGLIFSGLAAADEASVRRIIAERYPQSQLENVSKTPIAGIYEVYADGRIWYVDENVDYVLQGALGDTRTRQNITEQRLRQLSAIPFEQLPLDKAIKVVRGDGRRVLAVFADPDCPYCRQLEQELEKADNVTAYIFLMPIESTHPGAIQKSRRIWCSADRAKAWTEAVMNGVLPAVSEECDTPLEDIAELAGRYRIAGTPTLIFADGTRVSGAIGGERLESALGPTRRLGLEVGQ